MKTIKFLLVSALSLIAFVACNSDEIELENYEAKYAENASISCSDPNFTVSDDGVVVSFKVSGGEITINVDCGTEWTARNNAEDLFDCSTKVNSVTITAGQNLVEKERTGTITLMTMPSQIEFATITVVQDAYNSPKITVDVNEWNAPAIGNLSTEIVVEANGEWAVENDSDWITIEKTENSVILTVMENDEITVRTSEVVVTCADEFNSYHETITVTQDGLAYLNLSEEEISVSSFGSSASVTVESNFGLECLSNVDWTTVTVGKNSFTVEYTKNETGNDREGVVSITAGDGASNVAETEFRIIQSWENYDALILEYTVTSNNATVYLPICGVSNATIDWDDGEITTVSSDQPHHRYSTPGIYSVTINGSVNKLYSNERATDLFTGGEYLTAVKQWGNTGLTSLSYAFNNYSGLKTVCEDTSGGLKNVTGFDYAFRNCSSLVSVPSFEGCSSAYSFESCFYGCVSLTSLPENMFNGCTRGGTFKKCFYGCSGLTSLPENIFSDCMAAYEFSGCFDGCSGLTSLPENIFSDHSKVTDFSDCFHECSGLTSLPENMFSGCSAVTDFRNCFWACRGLTSLPENMFSGCSAVTKFSFVFRSCSSLKTVPVDLFDDAFLVTEFDGAFMSCSLLEGESPYTEIEIDGKSVKVHLYERDGYAPQMRWPSSSGKHCFYKCTGLSDYNSIPDEWRTY